MPGEPQPVVSAVIVSFNTREMTLDCLHALTKSQFNGTMEIFVVDNNSKDGSVEAIRDTFPAVRVITNSQNVGFGAANNQAMRLAMGDYILLLNSDAFVKQDAVASLLNCLRGHPDAGVVGPRLLNDDGSMQRSCFRFPSPGQAWRENLWISRCFGPHSTLGDLQTWAHDQEREVDWVVGACMLVRRTVWERIRGFDERFFLYGEETDWQRRIRDAGWKIVFCPDAIVTHLGGTSGESNRPARDRHFFDGVDHYVRKHHGLIGLVSLRCAMIAGCGMRFMLWLAVWIASAFTRSKAVAKMRLHLWLVGRQMFHWRFVW